MEALSADSYARLLDAIAGLNSDIALSTFPERAVDAVAAAVDVDFTSYNEVDTAAGTHRFLLRPDITRMPPDDPEYTALVRRFANHPAVAGLLASGAAPADLLPAWMNDHRLRLLGLVGNCCGQAELFLNISLTVARRPSRLIGIAVNRSVRDFDADDAARLGALQPHLAAAYRNALRYSQDDRRAGGADLGGHSMTELPLTRRESEVLYWVSMGKTNEEVGAIIGARPLTVKKHLEHIYDKLGVPNRTAAARLGAARLDPAVAT